jgi:hypothetical protein
VSCCEQLFKATGQTPKVQGWKVFLGNVDPRIKMPLMKQLAMSWLPIVAEGA